MSEATLPNPAVTGNAQGPPVVRLCFAHNHMKLAEYGLWTHAREISHDSRVFYLDGRKVAARFQGVGKSSVYGLVKKLVKRGWFVTIRQRRRLKNGMFAPGEYKPLSHDEWIEKHGSSTCCTSPETGTGASPETGTGPETGIGATSPSLRNDQSQFQERPVQKQGHKSEGLDLEGLNRRENPAPEKSPARGPTHPKYPEHILAIKAKFSGGAKLTDQEWTEWNRAAREKAANGNAACGLGTLGAYGEGNKA